MNQPTSYLTFPCDFPIKVFGKNTPDFESAVVTIINKHIHDLPEGAIKLKNSKLQNYLAITVNINAKSKTQLDAIYADLTASKEILMVL